MSREAVKHKARLAAMAILVADNVIDRRAGIDALLEHEVRKRPTPEQQAKWPKGYNTARAMALLVDKGDMPYSEAEHHIAAVIDGGTYTDAASDNAARYLSRALTGLDDARARISKELQEAIAKPVVLDVADITCTAPQKPTEAAQPSPRAPNARPVMRPPVGRV